MIFMALVMVNHLHSMTRLHFKKIIDQEDLVAVSHCWEMSTKIMIILIFKLLTLMLVKVEEETEVKTKKEWEMPLNEVCKTWIALTKMNSNSNQTEFKSLKEKDYALKRS